MKKAKRFEQVIQLGKKFVRKTKNRWLKDPEDDFAEFYYQQPIQKQRNYCNKFAVTLGPFLYYKSNKEK